MGKGHNIVDMEEEIRIGTGRRRAYRQHSFSERKQAISLYEQGASSKKIARELDLDDSMVRAWIRKYRAFGVVALEPYWRPGRRVDSTSKIRYKEKEDQFSKAYLSYANSLEPVASIARRYKLEYHTFRYHVERYHPELVEARERLKVVHY